MFLIVEENSLTSYSQIPKWEPSTWTTDKPQLYCPLKGNHLSLYLMSSYKYRSNLANFPDVCIVMSDMEYVIWKSWIYSCYIFGCHRTQMIKRNLLDFSPLSIFWNFDFIQLVGYLFFYQKLSITIISLSSLTKLMLIDCLTRSLAFFFSK